MNKLFLIIFVDKQIVFCVYNKTLYRFNCYSLPMKRQLLIRFITEKCCSNGMGQGCAFILAFVEKPHQSGAMRSNYLVEIVSDYMTHRCTDVQLIARIQFQKTLSQNYFIPFVTKISNQASRRIQSSDAVKNSAHNPVCWWMKSM